MAVVPGLARVASVDGEGGMKRSLVFASAVLLSLALVPSASAQSPAPFIGLWEGIDPINDASHHSITCSDDGTDVGCDLVVEFVIAPLCNDRGLGGGAGHLDGDELIFETVFVRCPDPLGPLRITYEHDPINDTLVATVMHNGQPLSSFPLHKISE
jgi:hypothetical protein